LPRHDLRDGTKFLNFSLTLPTALPILSSRMQATQVACSFLGQDEWACKSKAQFNRASAKFDSIVPFLFFGFCLQRQPPKPTLQVLTPLRQSPLPKDCRGGHFFGLVEFMSCRRHSSARRMAWQFGSFENRRFCSWRLTPLPCHGRQVRRGRCLPLPIGTAAAANAR
jgi:hypothetical protein